MTQPTKKLLILLAGAVLLLLSGQLQAQESRYKGRTLSEWQGDLKDLSPEVRKTTIEALGYFGSRAVSILAPFIGDPDFEVRGAASDVLVKLGAAAVPAMVRALEDKNSFVRWNAAGVLGRIGPAAKDAVPPLIQILKDPHTVMTEGRRKGHKFREIAALALGQIGHEAKDAIPSLVQALGDDTSEVREEVVGALGKIGPAAKDTIPDLLLLFVRENHLREAERPNIRREVAAALISLSTYAVCADARDITLALDEIRNTEVRARFGCWSGYMSPKNSAWVATSAVDVWIQFDSGSALANDPDAVGFLLNGPGRPVRITGGRLRFMAVDKEKEGVVGVVTVK